jgi:hypothetical protein
MKIQVKKSGSTVERSLNAVLAFALIATTFSCNRGYGCPTNFSFSDLLGDLIQVFLVLLF